MTMQPIAAAAAAALLLLLLLLLRVSLAQAHTQTTR
jgi:hypothetical protein